MALLPPDVKEAAINVAGTAFWYKDPLVHLLVEAGVPSSLVETHRDEPKFKLARQIFSRLEELGDNGFKVQKRIVLRMCQLRRPGNDVPDREAAIRAIKSLQKVALARGLVKPAESQSEKARKRSLQNREAAARAKSKRIKALELTFKRELLSTDKQGRGYTLERLLSELFQVEEIEYRKGYRTPTTQVDGYFKYAGFDYLLEARWRAAKPSVAEIGGFRQKIVQVMESTRGVFVSIVGFRPEVVAAFSGQGANMIFVDGEDLLEILESRWSLRDALDYKIEQAARQGLAFSPLRSGR